MTDEFLELGVEAARAGDYEKARSYFIEVVQTDPKSELGWLYLGKCLGDPDKKKYCFQKVLEINPSNPQAKAALEGLVKPGEPAQMQSAVVQPASPPAPEAKTGPGKKRPSRPLWIFIGGTVGLVICAGAFFVFALFSGLFGRASSKSPADIFPVPSVTRMGSLKVAASITPTRTPRPTWSPMYTATAFPSFTPEGDGSKEYWNEVELDNLNQVIEQDPNNAGAYFERAKLTYESAAKIGSLDVYISKLDTALRDVDKAISLRSDNGDYYSLRQSIYYDRAMVEENSVDNRYLVGMALDNGYKAYELGTTTAYPDRLIIVDLIYTDQCQKALAEVQKLIVQLPAGESSLGGLLHIRSSAYACLGRPEEALQSVKDSMFNNENMAYKKDLQIQYLILLGRYDEALPLLDEQICDCGLGGWRYYLRAMIYYYTGKKDLVQGELVEGMPMTWGRAGILSYVEAQLALDDGRKEDAIQLLQIAEATLDPTYNPLRWRIQRQLASLGAVPLKLTPSVPYQATPIP